MFLPNEAMEDVNVQGGRTWSQSGARGVGRSSEGGPRPGRSQRQRCSPLVLAARAPHATAGAAVNHVATAFGPWPSLGAAAAVKQEAFPPCSPAALRRRRGATALVVALASRGGRRWLTARRRRQRRRWPLGPAALSPGLLSARQWWRGEKPFPLALLRRCDGGAAQRRWSRHLRVAAAGASSRRGSGGGGGRSARQRSPPTSSRRGGGGEARPKVPVSREVQW